MNDYFVYHRKSVTGQFLVWIAYLALLTLFIGAIISTRVDIPELTALAAEVEDLKARVTALEAGVPPVEPSPEIEPEIEIELPQEDGGGEGEEPREDDSPLDAPPPDVFIVLWPVNGDEPLDVFTFEQPGGTFSVLIMDMVPNSIYEYSNELGPQGLLVTDSEGTGAFSGSGNRSWTVRIQ